MRSSRSADSRPTGPDDPPLAAFGLNGDDDAWLDHVLDALTPPEIGSIGPYEIVEEVARGGQGVVYRARQSAPHREIALKRLVEGRLASPAVRRRFEREVEAAAALQHPGVVPVYGMEVVDGTPVVAMRWVEGEHVDDWARGRGGPHRRERVLRLFLRICDAVEHAHRHGILHLDLKPSNVLVDDDGNPYVLDFGLALFTETDVDATRTEAFLGTLAYASPEQLRGARRRLDSRSDVYSMGVMLHELLTGTRPYDFEGGVASAIEAQARGFDGRASGLGDELGAIVRKALAPQREERYATVAALSEDVRRFLAGRPVLARGPGLLYELRKLAQRNRAATALGALVLLLVASFAGYAWRQAKLLEGQRDAETRARLEAEAAERRARTAETAAREAEDRALEEAAEAESVLAFLLNDVFEEAVPQKLGPDATVAELLAVASERCASRFADRPAVEASVRLALGRIRRKMNDFRGSAFDVARGLEVVPEGEEHDGVRARLAYRRGLIAFESGEVRESLDWFASAVELARDLPELAWLACDAHQAAAISHVMLGEPEEALASGERSLLLARELGGASGRLQPALVATGVASAHLGDFATAREHYEEALAVTRRDLGERHGQVADCHGYLADLDQAEGDLESAKAHARESLRIYRAVYGERHTQIASALGDLGDLLTLPEEVEEGAELLRNALEMTLELRGPDSLSTAIQRCRLGKNRMYAGELEESVAILTEELERIRAAGPAGVWVTKASEWLAWAREVLARKTAFDARPRPWPARVAEAAFPRIGTLRARIRIAEALHRLEGGEDAHRELAEAADFYERSFRPTAEERSAAAAFRAEWLRRRGDEVGAALFERRLGPPESRERENGADRVRTSSAEQ